MHKRLRLIPVLILAGLLAGCDPKPNVEQERQARIEALKREAEQERARREFWQALTYAAGVLAVILLIVGLSTGSRSRNHAGNRP